MKIKVKIIMVPGSVYHMELPPDTQISTLVPIFPSIVNPGRTLLLKNGERTLELTSSNYALKNEDRVLSIAKAT